MTARSSAELGCTPSGPERCYDAVDNDCNGLADDGCGVPFGVVTFRVAWDDPTADVDLEVVDTAGELVGTGAPSAGGLIKEHDCPTDSDCAGRAYESVYSVSPPPRSASYGVTLRLERIGEAMLPLAVALNARLGPTTYSHRLALGAAGQRCSYTFSF